MLAGSTLPIWHRQPTDGRLRLLFLADANNEKIPCRNLVAFGGVGVRQHGIGGGLDEARLFTFALAISFSNRIRNMEELSEGLKISRAGAEKDLPLEAFRRQIEAWSIAMPLVEPLVLDFGLDQFDRVGLIEYWIANERDAGYCGKYLFVFDGQECPSHSHRTKHETFFVVRGCLDVTMDGRSITLNPGDVLPVPPGHVHSFRGQGNSLLLELSMPCEVRDNRFENPRIMSWLKTLV